VKHSELRAAMDAAFGRRASSVAADLVLAPLDGRTADQALADGARPDDVWAAICEINELPEELRWHHRRERRRRS
jgi:hypothetical protein